MILGVTGGMGCGKSTVSRLFAQRGFQLLDADALVHASVLTEPAVQAALVEHFGPQVLKPAGGVDRAELGRKVFADEVELRWLEALVHPRLYALWRAHFSRAEVRAWVVEVPLLFEQQLENWFDFTLCVACSPEQQLARLEQRGMARGLAGQRLARQLPLMQKVARSDLVIWNSGSPEFLQAEVDHLAAKLNSRS